MPCFIIKSIKCLCILSGFAVGCLYSLSFLRFDFVEIPQTIDLNYYNTWRNGLFIFVAVVYHFYPLLKTNKYFQSADLFSLKYIGNLFKTTI